jgi:acyl-coenzyme A thioesterase PaaI-like protein
MAVAKVRPMIASLHDDTVLTRVAEGRYTRTVGAEWDGTSGVLGGHALALMVAAMADTLAATDGAARDQTIASLTATFMRPLPLGAVELAVEPLRVGRSTGTWRMRIGAAGGDASIEATVLTTAPRWPARFVGIVPPVVEPPGEHEESWDPGIGMTAHDQFRYYPRFAQETEAVGGGWVLPLGRFPNDERLVAMVSDLWLPPVLARFDRPAMVVGLTCTVHFRTPHVSRVLRTGEPVLVRLRTRLAADGIADETGEVWSPSGALLATSLHVRLVLPPT